MQYITVSTGKTGTSGRRLTECIVRQDGSIQSFSVPVDTVSLFDCNDIDVVNSLSIHTLLVNYRSSLRVGELSHFRGI